MEGQRDKQEVAWQLARSLEVAFDDNASVQIGKADMVERSSWTLLVLTGLVAVAALLLVFASPG